MTVPYHNEGENTMSDGTSKAARIFRPLRYFAVALLLLCAAAAATDKGARADEAPVQACNVEAQVLDVLKQGEVAITKYEGDQARKIMEALAAEAGMTDSTGADTVYVLKNKGGVTGIMYSKAGCTSEIVVVDEDALRAFLKKVLGIEA